MKLLSLFSGIGAFEKALVNLGIPYELVGYCEIDKWASASYAAIHNVSEDMNLGDITKVDEKALPKDIDLITYGFPCQDISLAGKQKGLFNEDGTQTRSGLFFEALRIIEETKPCVAIAENVKNLVGKKFKEQFKIVLDSLEAAGYNNYWKVLNAKDYGVPQNRERVFIVSIRKDIDTGRFEFPKGFPLELRLKDVLEEEVDEKFYIDNKYDSIEKVNDNYSLLCGGVFGKMHDISRRAYNTNYVAPSLHTCGGGNLEPKVTIEQTDKIMKVGEINASQDGVVVSPEGIASTHTAGHGNMPKVLVREATKQGYAEAVEGDSINLEQPNSKTRRGRVGKQVAQTLTTTPQQAVVEPMALDEQNGYIRKDGCVGTITTDGSSPKKNNRVIVWDGFNQRVRADQSCVGTITQNVGADLKRNGQGIIEMPCSTRGSQVASTIRSTIYKQGERNLMQNIENGLGYEGVIESALRIRKLTPRECFRLMGFDDNDFEKAEAVNSNTQLYKQAGNSIVVPVVAHIITELCDCGALYGPVKGTSSFDIEAELKMVEIIATVTDDDVDALKAFFRSRGIPKTNYTIY